MPVPPPALVLVGVESTGKTTLARRLAAATGRVFVPEVARGWLEARGGRYEESDLLTLARLQNDAELDARRRWGAVVVDTDLVVLRVWSEARYGRCADEILAMLAARGPASYLLPVPDLPWQADPLRETPALKARHALHARYVRLLAELGHPWAGVHGEGQARWANARAALRGLN